MRWRISKLMILSVGFILGGSAPLSMIVPALATQAATTTPTSASSSSTDDTAVSKVAATNVMAVSADTTSTTDDSSSSGNTTSSVSSSSSSSTTDNGSSSSSSTSSTAASDTTSTTGELPASGTMGTVSWTIDSDGVLTLSGGSFQYLPANASPWADYATAITSIKITGVITITTAPNYAYLFSNLTNLTTITGLSNLSMDGVTSTQQMFYMDAKLTSVDFGQTDFSTVTNMSGMFDGCTALTSIGDTDEWQTGNVTDMSRMFASCTALTKVGTTGWNVSQVTSMNSMFISCSNLATVDVSAWKTNSLVSARYLFYRCAALTSLDVSGWNTSNVTDMSYLFSGCSGVTTLDVSKWSTQSVTTLAGTFQSCSKVTTLDVSNWTVQGITSLASTFQNCSKVTTLKLSGWDTTDVTTLANTFQSCSSLTQLDISGWNIGTVASLAYTFSGCSKVTTLDVDSWDTSSVTTMDHTFYNCVALTSANVSNWQTSNVTTVADMFANDKVLTKLDLSGWNTKLVTNMQEVFMNCTGLTTLDLSSWDTSKATTYTNVFVGDTKLQHLTLGSDFTFHGDSTMALQSPSSITPYTGEWQKGTSGKTYNSADLMSSYDGSTMAGTYNWAKVGGAVTVKYVDEDGTEIAAEQTLSGTAGQDYTTTSEDITGYTLSVTPDNATGTYGDEAITVTYVYAGNLFFNSSPATLDFGSHALSGTTETYAPTLDKLLEVQNNGKLNSTWNLTAELGSTGFVGTETGRTLGATLYYQTGDSQIILSPGVAAQVYSQTTTNHEGVDISGSWSDNAGLLLKVPSGAATIDEYQGTISWSLNNTVANN